MPSNQLPEDVLRDGHARFHDQSGNTLGADECEWEGCQFWESATTIAPLITEWARKDQAEKDARLIEPKSATMGTFLAGTIRAQFTPETTGGE